MKVLCGGQNLQYKINKAKEGLIEKFDLPRDVVLNIPKITIIGDDEITIENHRGVMLFSQNQIKVNSNLGVIFIEGNYLEILFIEGSTIVVSGKFKSIIYEGKKNE